MLPDRFADQRVDWALDAIGDSADNWQITKQADALTLLYLLSDDGVVDLLARLGYRFDRDGVRRTAHRYLARTTHRSSLSRVVYAGALARADPALSWRLFQQALGTDLHGLKGESTAEGIHLGAKGGTLDTLQRRYLGISTCRAGLRVDPALPAQLGRVRLDLRFRGQALQVEADRSALRIRSAPGNDTDVAVFHQAGETPLKPGAELCIGAVVDDGPSE